jgi:hypothetical protein
MVGWFLGEGINVMCFLKKVRMYKKSGASKHARAGRKT